MPQISLSWALAHYSCLQPLSYSISLAEIYSSCPMELNLWFCSLLQEPSHMQTVSSFLCITKWPGVHTPNHHTQQALSSAPVWEQPRTELAERLNYLPPLEWVPPGQGRAHGQGCARKRSVPCLPCGYTEDFSLLHCQSLSHHELNYAPTTARTATTTTKQPPKSYRSHTTLMEGQPAGTVQWEMEVPSWSGV